MRKDEYVFNEWALKLFAKWSPLDPACPLQPASVDMACRRLLRQHCLSRPLGEIPGLGGVTRFWLAAWWCRLYGPLVAPYTLLSWANHQSPGDHPRLWLATAARLGPDAFSYKEPEMFCWDGEQQVNSAGIYFACCSKAGFFHE